MTRAIIGRARAAFFVSSVLLLLGGAWLGRTTRDSQGLVRLGNSLGYEIGDDTSYEWTPATMPTDFRRETPAAPRSIAAAARRILKELPATSSEFEKVLPIASHLASAPERAGNPIQCDTVRAFKEITQSGEGYCADYTEVLDGLALAAGIPIREWGMSFDGFGGDGHALSEISDGRTQSWIFIDSY